MPELITYIKLTKTQTERHRHTSIPSCSIVQHVPLKSNCNHSSQQIANQHVVVGNDTNSVTQWYNCGSPR